MSEPPLTPPTEDAPTRDLTPDLAPTAAPARPRVARVVLPERVGPYRVEQEIGRGAMGVVARAWDERLARPVALKFLDAHYAGDEAELLRVEREGRLLAAIRHPHVALIHGVEDHDGAPVLVLELVEGETLADRIARGPLSIEEALDVGAQIAAALEAAHARGIVHRDLKPGNVKLGADGIAKVLDFGIACRLASDVPRSLASEAGDADPEGLASGTLGYMPPEQILGAPASLAGDSFALGCVLFEALTGRPAFPGATGAQRLRSTLERRPELDALPEDLPASARDLVVACLARDPAARPRDAGVVRHALEQSLGRRARAPLIAPAPDGRPRLPRPRSRFVGREAELAALREAIVTRGLVTLTGAGGSGKTRVALELGLRVEAGAQEGGFADGAAFVELAIVEDEAAVVTQVAIALGVADRKGAATLEVVVEALAGKDMLLMLDSCEHLSRAAAELVRAVTAGCPRVTVLATSREPLRVDGERVVPLPSLSVPPAGAKMDAVTAEGNDSVALLMDRARAVRRGLALDAESIGAIVRCCRALDGIPLAIELAAARLRQFDVRQLADELERSLHILAGGSPSALARHQALAATIDWSHDQLDDEERALHRRLSVLAGPFTLELAEKVGASDPSHVSGVLGTLSRLHEKSLLEAVDGMRAPRWRQLAPIRQHAAEKLVRAKEKAATQDRFLDAMGRIGRDAAARLQDHRVAGCVADLADEHPHLMEAARLAAEAGRIGDGFRLLTNTGDYFITRGLWREARAAVEALLARDGGADAEGRATALLFSAQLSLMLGEGSEAEARGMQALERFKEAGDASGTAETLSTLSSLAWERLDLAKARSLGEESLALRRSLGQREPVANSLNQLGVAALSSGDYAAARDFLGEAAAIQRDAGNASALAVILSNLAVVMIRLGDLPAARGLFLEALEAARSCSARRGELFALTNLASIEVDLERGADAVLHQRAAAAIARELSDRSGALSITLGCARMALLAGEATRAATLLGAATALRDSMGAKRFHNPARVEAIETGARAAIGDEPFESAFAEGRELSFDAALSLAEGTPAPG